MKLTYFNSTNFGDALNKMIFGKFLDGYLSEESNIDFLGIGSILGLDFALSDRKKIVFSSGFAYGTLPNIDNTYDIYCVRGPKTAEKLELSEEFAIGDGAILLQFFDFDKVKKEYDFSFMPHWESELKYDWRKVCSKLGIHYVSPNQEVEKTLMDIRKSKVVIAEAMHFAIAADALRVPWIPVKCYKGINDFKWEDWTASIFCNYNPYMIPSLYQDTVFNRNLIKTKISKLIPSFISSIGLNLFEMYQKFTTRRKVVNILNSLKNVQPSLSNPKVLKNIGDQLLVKLDEIKTNYPSNPQPDGVHSNRQ